MNRKRWSKKLVNWFLFLPPLLLGLGVVAWLVTAKQELPRVEQEMRAIPVHVLRSEHTEVYAEVTGYGTAKAFRTWTAVAEVGGRISATHPQLRDGIYVRPGELLIAIDPEDYQIRVQQRDAERVQAQSQLDRIKLQAKADRESLEIQKQLLEVRQNEVRRLERLRSGIASSAAELDAAKAVWLTQTQTVQNLESSLATYDAQIESAEASVAFAESGLKTARRDVERTRVQTPFGGVLTGVSLEQSQYVAPNQQLFQVIDSSAVEIEAQFSLAQLSKLMPRSLQSSRQINSRQARMESFPARPVLGDRRKSEALDDWGKTLDASVRVRSGDVETSFPARVARFTGTVDEQTRTFGVVVRVESEAESLPLALQPGAYCEVNLKAASPTIAHVIPRDSLKSNTVLVVEDGNYLARRNVKVAFAKQDLAAVVDGIGEGDLVVLNPSSSIRAGALVDPKPVAMQAVTGTEGSHSASSVPLYGKPVARSENLSSVGTGGSHD